MVRRRVPPDDSALSGFGFESGISADEIIGGPGGTWDLALDESGALLPGSSGFPCDSSSGEGGYNILLTRGR